MAASQLRRPSRCSNMEPPTGQRERCEGALCSMPENNMFNKKAWRSWVEVSSRKLQRAQGNKKPAKPQEEQFINTIKKPLIKDQMGCRRLEGRECAGERRKTKRTFRSSWKCVQTAVASFIKNLLQAVNQLCQSAVVNQIIELFHI